MPTYRDWTLPLNSQHPAGVFLHSLAPTVPDETVVYYSKYTIGVIGALDLASDTNNVKEWSYPTRLFTSVPWTSTSLTRLARGESTIWAVATDYHGAIVRFVPSSGTFTRYTTTRPGTPMNAPTDLKIDGKGMLWFIGGSGAGTNGGSTISCFNPRTASVKSWAIPPNVMGGVQSINPSRDGKRVWISSLNPGSTRQWIGRFDVGTTPHTLTCFSPTPYANPPGCICLRLQETPGAKDRVWFTATDTTTRNKVVPGIYRLDDAASVFDKYESPKMRWPKYITLDPKGVAWVSDVAAASLIRCDPQQSCTTVPFTETTVQLRPTRQVLRATSANAPLVQSTAPMSDYIVTTNNHPCTTEFTAAMQFPECVRYLEGRTYSGVLVVNPTTNKIGLFTP